MTTKKAPKKAPNGKAAMDALSRMAEIVHTGGPFLSPVEYRELAKLSRKLPAHSGSRKVADDLLSAVRTGGGEITGWVMDAARKVEREAQSPRTLPFTPKLSFGLRKKIFAVHNVLEVRAPDELNRAKALLDEAATALLQWESEQ